METLLFWVGGLEAFGFVTLAVATVVLWRATTRIEPNAALQRELRELEGTVADLVDHITRKETRERVRKMRDGREAKAADADPQIPPAGTPEYKQYLRTLARERVGR